MTTSRHGQPGRLRVVSYNVHSCVGTDGVFAPTRIAEVLAALDADFIALQEVEERSYRGTPVSRFLANTLDLHRAGRSTHKRAGIDYGNVLLSSTAPVRSVAHDIAVPKREPRGAIEARFDHGGKTLRIIATHFGIAMRERRAQLQKLLGLLDRRGSDVTILCADFNEWLPYSRTHRALSKVLGATPALRTFPSRYPGLSLDRIYASPVVTLQSIRTVASADAKTASDHLPLVADFELN